MSEQKQKDTLVYNYIKACYPEAAEIFRKAAKLEVAANVNGQLAFVIGSILVHGVKRQLSPMRNGPGPKKSKADSATVKAVLNNLAGKQMKTAKSNLSNNNIAQPGVSKDSSSESSDSDDPKKRKMPHQPTIRSPVKTAPTPVSEAKKAESSDESSDSDEEVAPKKLAVATTKPTLTKVATTPAAKKADSDSDDSDSSESTPPKKVQANKPNQASPVKSASKPVTAKAKAESTDDSDSDEDSEDAKKPKMSFAAKKVAVCKAPTPGAKNTPKSVSESSEKIANNDDNSDDSDSDEEDNKKPTKLVATPAKATPKPPAKKQESSDDSDSSSSEDEKQAKTPAKKATPVIAKTPVQTKPALKATTPAKKEDSGSSDSDDDSDDDDDANKKPAKTVATKVTPKVSAAKKPAEDSDSSDSDSEEEEPVKTKTKVLAPTPKFTPKPDFKSKSAADTPQSFTPGSHKRKTSPFRRVKSDGTSGFGGDSSFKITGKTADPFTNLKGKEFKKEKTKKKKGFNKPM